jgi:hypothetical protein
LSILLSILPGSGTRSNIFVRRALGWAVHAIAAIGSRFIYQLVRFFCPRDVGRDVSYADHQEVVQLGGSPIGIGEIIPNLGALSDRSGLTAVRVAWLSMVGCHHLPHLRRWALKAGLVGAPQS